MSRKTERFIGDHGRDMGKVFILTEMPAARAEKWALRALMALASSGVEPPDDLRNIGAAGLLAFGWKTFGGLPWEVAEPLLDEAMTCAQYMPDPNKPQVLRQLVDSDIEEIGTRIKMRMALWKLHVDFSLAGDESTSDSATA